MTMFGSSDPLFLMEGALRMLRLQKDRLVDPEMVRAYNFLVNDIEKTIAYYKVWIANAEIVATSDPDSTSPHLYRID